MLAEYSWSAISPWRAVRHGWRVARRAPGRLALHAGLEPVEVVLGEDAGYQLGPAADAYLGEQGFDVVADRVGGDAEPVSDLGGSRAPGEEQNSLLENGMTSCQDERISTG